MKPAAGFFILAWALTVSGCAAIKPSPGMAMLRVHVRVQPKAGYKTPVERAEDLYFFESADPASRGRFALVDYLRLEDVIVWIEPLDGQQLEHGGEPVVVEIRDGRDGRDVPSAVVIAGSAVTVSNRTAAAREVYAASEDGQAFIEFGVVEPRSKRQAVIEAPGRYEVLTEQGDAAIARLCVLPAGQACLTRSARCVTFNNLPPGRYRAVCQHHRLPGDEAEVRVEADQVATVALTLTVNRLPEVE